LGKCQWEFGAGAFCPKMIGEEGQEQDSNSTLPIFAL
jgi:hypothetical protein